MKILKVRILVGRDGGNLYPRFNDLPKELRGDGMDWSMYVDRFGSGWLYDKKADHKTADSYSPKGEQVGMLIVPDDFADAAAASFPEQCAICGESECRWFFESRAMLHVPDVEIDENIVRAIDLRLRAGIPITGQERKALDPEDDTPGIRKNKAKSWDDFKSSRQFGDLEDMPFTPPA